MKKVTNKQIRNYLGHNGRECIVRVSRDGRVMRFGSSVPTDRSHDFWVLVGRKDEIVQEIEYAEKCAMLMTTDDTVATFTVRGRQFIATAEGDEREYWLVYELVGNRSEVFSRELLQPGISRAETLEALERYTRTNITFAEVIAAETAAA